MKTKSIFEPAPRWENAPQVCVYENLLSFKAENQIGAYQEKNCPSSHIYRKWWCPVCGGYHFSDNEKYLPRAEWEGKINPQTPGAVLFVIRFKASEVEEPGFSERVASMLRADGAPVELPEDAQMTYKRRHGGTGTSEQFALCGIHKRRMDNGDILYGWHITSTPNTETK